MSLGLLGGVLFHLLFYNDTFIGVIARPTAPGLTGAQPQLHPTLGPLFIWVCGFTIWSSHDYPINYYPILSQYYSNIIPILSTNIRYYSNILPILSQYYQLLFNIISILSVITQYHPMIIPSGHLAAQCYRQGPQPTCPADRRRNRPAGSAVWFTRPVVGNEDLGRSIYGISMENHWRYSWWFKLHYLNDIRLYGGRSGV